MKPTEIAAAALALRQAAQTREYIAPLRESYPDITIESAYAIQRLNTMQKCDDGHRMVGCKIGLTSVAVQRQLGVDQPDFGMLFDDMCYGDSEPIPFETLTQPKIEAEIAFVLGRDLTMQNPGPLDVLNAVEYLLPALEVVGSRIADWNIRIADTIADNASSSAFVLGTTPKKLGEIDLRLCGMVLERAGDLVSTGAGAACLGNPLNAVVWLARTMAGFGTPLKAGSVVLSGALGPMATVRAGDIFEARISGLGSVRAVFGQTTEGAA
ncbi:fumarylacetoacetate hydrolase family protein (plasmid) [Cupriavidus sp. P-10]|uniref:2-keto-4-pentenoate hydratase n=1 Tax=Cupriavidus sp. P-10 TaxID=2027911 RepID=UPI000E2EA562|nr:fumarylacetoacetate hydrolase family protein [Cupriavidus sp. P-10]BDB29630.1 fumarylacetoacetate hydrolase family protein [Cupriavidus sp. P-10]